MSQRNIELAHRAIAAFNRRDLDAFLALMDAEIEFTPYERAVEGLGPYVGHDGVRTWWEESFVTLPDFAAEILEVRDLGDITVIRGRLHGTGAASGASFERTLWMAVEWRGGKEVWWHAFQSEDETLAAVALRK